MVIRTIFLILFTFISLEIIFSSKLNDLIVITEKHLIEEASRISKNFENKCQLVKDNLCFSGKLYQASTEQKTNRNLQTIQNNNSDGTQTNAENQNSTTTNTCALSACNSLTINSPNLKCLNNFKLVNPININVISSISSSASQTECNNQNLLLNQSTIKTADLNYPITDPKSNSVKETICATQFLDSDFISPYKVNPLLSYLQFGSVDGVYRRFPGGVHCSSYDHRQRRWFEQAINSPRNILFAVDFSGGLNNAGRKDLLIRTLLTLVDWFDSSIWTGVVPLSSPMSSEFPTTFKKVDVKSKKDLIDMINNIEFKGDLDFNLETVNNFLRNSQTLKMGSNCPSSKEKETLSNTLVIFMMGSEISNFDNLKSVNSATTSSSTLDTTASDTIALVENFNSIYLNFGKPINSFFKAQQCLNRSIYLDVTSPSEVEVGVNTIKKFIALGNMRNIPVWNRYQDFFGLGEVFTGSIPIYVGSELIGVYAADISVEKIKKEYTDYEFDLRYYTLKAEDCITQLPVSDCVLESLRNVKCFDDLKSFDQKCADEKSKSILSACSGNLSDNLEVLCPLPADDFKYHLANVSAATCCADDSNKLLSVSQEMEILNKSTIITLASSSDKSSNTISSSSSESRSDKGEEYITELDSSQSTNSTNTTSASSISSDKSKEEEESNVDLYILIIFVIIVVIFVMWYLKKNEPKPYLSSVKNNELSMSMNQSNRPNYYSTNS